MFTSSYILYSQSLNDFNFLKLLHQKSSRHTVIRRPTLCKFDHFPCTQFRSFSIARRASRDFIQSNLSWEFDDLKASDIGTTLALSTQQRDSPPQPTPGRFLAANAAPSSPTDITTSDTEMLVKTLDSDTRLQVEESPEPFPAAPATSTQADGRCDTGAPPLAELPELAQREEEHPRRRFQIQLASLRPLAAPAPVAAAGRPLAVLLARRVLDEPDLEALRAAGFPHAARAVGTSCRRLIAWLSGPDGRGSAAACVAAVLLARGEALSAQVSLACAAAVALRAENHRLARALFEALAEGGRARYAASTDCRGGTRGGAEWFAGAPDAGEGGDDSGDAAARRAFEAAAAAGRSS